MIIILAFIAFAVAAYLFIHFIVKRDRGSKEPRGALFGAIGFGVLAVIAAGELNNLFIPPEVINQIGSEEAGGISTQTLLFSALGVGLIEESVKCLPLAFFIYKKRYFNELTDGVIYFGLVGLTFGIIEDIFYTLEYGGGVGLMRILFSPYLHAGFAVIFGMYLIQRKVLRKPWLVAVLGFIGAVLAHGIFDFAAFTGGPLSLIVLFTMAITINVMLFVFFRKAQKIDESRGMSAIGTNKFCRDCGRPNPERHLYCQYCGKLS
ncbi:MAG: PrsW family intramembrane metalloprotease [Candidatus Saccharimonadales bacterium]